MNSAKVGEKYITLGGSIREIIRDDGSAIPYKSRDVISGHETWHYSNGVTDVPGYCLDKIADAKAVAEAQVKAAEEKAKQAEDEAVKASTAMEVARAKLEEAKKALAESTKIKHGDYGYLTGCTGENYGRRVFRIDKGVINAYDEKGTLSQVNAAALPYNYTILGNIFTKILEAK